MSNDQTPGGRPMDPAIAAALKAASKTIPVTQGEQFRLEVVVDAKGEVLLSIPPPQQEGMFWKMMAYLPDYAKAHYAQKRSPLAI